MIPKYKEIYESWLTSLNPSEKDKMMAEERKKICSDCHLRSEVIKNLKWSHYCKGCGCPINKKAFSKIFNPCPLKKWEHVDLKYIGEIKEKQDKSVI